MLEKFFAEDHGTAADSSDSAEIIKADVLSRIEREKPMKNFRIKPLIIAAAITAVGAASIAITVSASTDSEAVEDIPRLDQTSGYYVVAYPPEPEYLTEFAANEGNMARKHVTGLVKQAVNDGGIKIEKELDETDVVGFVPYRKGTDYEPSEEALEIIHLIEEDPEALGLVPAGKSEKFEGGLRIVNRHFENTNEAVDGKKTFYSVRRIYTDDEKNTLLASLYLSNIFEFDPDENTVDWYVEDYRPYKKVMSVFLDHTENGCRLVNGQSGMGGEGYFTADNGKDLDSIFRYIDLKPDPDGKEVRVGLIIAVDSEGVQWMD